ncbi:MAG TPA: hypothetical protein VJ761_06525 [Ktedonobacteraceae bacterium]|nr:hypothetical protein [Ktedonobacteraceae bacterium]
MKSANPTSQWNELLGIAAISASDVWTVGYAYPDQYTPDQTLAEHWDGSHWTVVATQNVGYYGSELAAVSAVSSTDVWAVGSYLNVDNSSSTLIEHWDGKQWSIISSPNAGSNTYLIGVAALTSNNVWAIGDEIVSGAIDSLIEHWDGASWSVVSNPGSVVLIGLAAASPTNIWAVGSSQGPSSMHWDGTSWSVIPALNEGYNASLYGVAVDPNTGDAWSVGTYEYGDHARTLIESWNGEQWQIVTSPNVGAFDNVLKAVTAISVTNVWAVGYYISPKTTNRLALIEHWDGQKWRVVTSPIVGRQFSQHDNFLNASTQVPGTTQVWAAGYFISPPPYAYTLTDFYC